MQDHTLRVGEELVIPGYARLTILRVDEDEVFLGIIAKPNDVQGQLRLRLMAVREASLNDIK